jgi:hypothetical protein
VAWMKKADRSRKLAGFRTRMTRYDGVVLHVAVSEARFPHYGAGLGAHFYVRKDGSWAQQIDTQFKGGHAYQGNFRLIGIESQGGTVDPQNEPWTAAQCEAIAQILAFLHRKHGIPLRLMDDSSSRERGVGYHRLGCNGNFPRSGLKAGRSQRGGGEYWSTSVGKICPGDAKIEQIPGIIARAKEIVSGKKTLVTKNRTTVAAIVAARGIRPVRVGVVGRHVVRDDVEHDPEPELAYPFDQPLEPLLTTELVVQPGTYFNPQTEVVVIVDDSTSLDQEIFNMEAYEGAEWVRISDEVPVDEDRRDRLLEEFQDAIEAYAESDETVQP